MTREELRDNLIEAIKDKTQCWRACKGAGPASVCRCEMSADAAIALVLGEAAKVAGPSPDDAGTHRSYRQGREDAAASIRALIPSEDK